MADSLVARLVEVFFIGVGTPVTAVCALPLYPAFVAYLANNEDEEGRAPSPLVVGLLVVAGVITFVGLVGYVFTTVLQESVTTAVELVSLPAFGLLVIVGLALLADLEVFSRIPSVEPPQFQYPSATAFSYGFFFGTLVLPCNPGFIALLFARTPVLFDTRAASMLGFLCFGLGIGTPLLVLSVLSESLGRRVTRTLASYRGPINRVTGGIVLGVSAYYLLFVFDVLG
jgi:cytochrome c-type biogenesis protein